MQCHSLNRVATFCLCTRCGWMWRSITASTSCAPLLFPTQTLQLDVEELFASLLDWDIGKAEKEGDDQAQRQQQEEQQQQQTQQQQQDQQQRDRQGASGGAAGAAPVDGGTGAAPADGGSGAGGAAGAAGRTAVVAPDSKRLCGNVASDQPDLIGLDVWPAGVALCQYLAASPALVSGAAVCELGAGEGWESFWSSPRLTRAPRLPACLPARLPACLPACKPYCLKLFSSLL